MHIRRAHGHVGVWRSASHPDPPDIDPSEYGWEKDPITRTLVPIQLPANTPIAPDALLTLLCCTCDSSDSCKTKRCSCHRNNTGCGTLCKCTDSDSGCHNPFSPKRLEESVNEDLMGEDDSDDDNVEDNEDD